MNLDRARSFIKERINLTFKFIYVGSRNQKEEFVGKIIKCFNSVFVIETTEKVIKTFSYNDFIMNNIKIISLQ